MFPQMCAVVVLEEKAGFYRYTHTQSSFTAIDRRFKISKAPMLLLLLDFFAIVCCSTHTLTHTHTHTRR